MRSHWAGGLALASGVLGCHAATREPAAPGASVTVASAGEGAREAEEEAPAESACSSVMMSLVSAVSGTPCGVTGALGLRWGERATRAGARLGVTCEAWSTSFVSSEFAECATTGPTVAAYGARAHVTLVGRGGRLAGVRLEFERGTRWEDIRAAARDELGLSGESVEAPYTVFANDSLVRVEPGRGREGVTVVVASPAFGKAYVGYLLGQGLGGLFRVH